MIWHTIHTMTIGRYMDMTESKNLNLVNRYSLPLPKKYAEQAKIRLNTEFNKLINLNDVVEMLEEGVHKSSLAIRVDLLIPPLYNAIKMHFTRKGEIIKDEFALSTYKEICSRELKTADDIEYLLHIQKELIYKYKELYPEIEVKKATISLTRVIHLLELGMPHPINRNSKLYELAGFIEIAKEKRIADGRN